MRNFRASPKLKTTAWLLATVSVCMAVFAAVLMTEPGQMLDIERRWIVQYHEYRVFYGIVVVTSFLGFVVLGWRQRVLGPALGCILAAVVGLALFASNSLLDLFFPSLQREAVYVSVVEGDKTLEDEEVVYAVELGGEAVAYPRRFMMIPHIAGKTIGGQEVVMTYCALSNLPVVYENQLAGRETELGVLIQTNNNLVLYDDNSGEVIQQITGQTEFGAPKMKTYANQMMSWGSFKALYPSGEVFLYPYDRWLDHALLAVFDSGLKQQYDPEQGPMFPTLELADNRLPQKEQIWGLDLNGEQVAFARSFFADQRVYNMTLGNLPVVLHFDDDYETLAAFYRQDEKEVLDVDVFGNTRRGRLPRVAVHNGVFWMVWSHFYPDTNVKS